MSPLLFELYLNAAREVLDKAIVTGSQPKELTWRYESDRPGKINAMDRNPEAGKWGHTALMRQGQGPVNEGWYEMQASFGGYNGFGKDSIRIWGTPISTKGTYIVRVEAAAKPVPTRKEVLEWWEEYQNQVTDGNRRARADRLLREDALFDYGHPRLMVRIYEDIIFDEEVSNPPGSPKIYEATFEGEPTGDRNNRRWLEVLVANSYLMPVTDAARKAGLGGRDMPQPELLVKSVEIVGPVYESWPPESHKRILFDSPIKDSDERGYAREVLERFMAKAWRRTLRTGEVEEKLELFAKVREQTSSLEEAIKIPLAAILTSPNFIFLAEPIVAKGTQQAANAQPPVFRSPDGKTITAKALGRMGDQVLLEINGTKVPASIHYFSQADQAYFRSLPEVGLSPGTKNLTDFELASRISYFLWSSMPDDELFQLAASGRLRSAEELAGQVDRMLVDPKSGAFVENFASQWLGLRDADANAPSQGRFPRYTASVHRDLIQESKAFFSEILRQDLSILNFLDSDFLVINDNLARHYGITGVKGSQFQKVSIPEDNPRGGLLGQGAIHGITSNGTRTSPVDRGVWILENILGDPPPPPPPDAGDLAPNVPGIGKASVRERLAAHREIQQCASCHDKIDPLGFALENFGPDGRWRNRETYRNANLVLGNDPLIDASAQLPDGTKFKGVDELKELLKGRHQQFVTNFTKNLMTYALGRGMEWSDQELLRRLAEESSKEGYVMREMIKDIVRSPAFLSK